MNSTLDVTFKSIVWHAIHEPETSDMPNNVKKKIYCFRVTL